MSVMLILSSPARADSSLIDGEELHHGALVLKSVDVDRLLARERTGDWRPRHDLGALSVMLQDLVRDLERGGAQTADFLRAHPESAHDLRIVLRHLYKNEAYRKIIVELDPGEPRRNLYAMEFPESLASLSNPIRDGIISERAHQARHSSLRTFAIASLLEMIPPAGVAEFAGHAHGAWIAALSATGAIAIGACALIMTGESETKLRSPTRF